MKRKLKSLVLTLLLIMICTSLFSGCTENANADTIITSQEEAETAVLLGDLNQNAPDDVKNKLAQLVHETNTYSTERESNGDYEMSDDEYILWEKITSLLDKETIRQFGEEPQEDEIENTNFDYGKDTMANLKQILTNEDWTTINNIRNKYFYAIENDDQNYDVDTEAEIKTILNKYKELDSVAVTLNLLNSKNQHDLGMFKITPEFDAVYQSGSENGLTVLNEKEQESLEAVWEHTTDILPKELFANFKYFKVGGDGKLGSDAYVIPVDSEGKLWCMAVDPDDISDDNLFPYTVVHEMGHYLTLNENQVEYFDDNEVFYPIDRYSDSQCVAKEDSYIQAFYELFWKDIINDWRTNQENPYFYYRHKSQFITEYSASECAEDIAECFSAYVFLDKAATPETQRKYDFFNSYPEFRSIKNEILNNVKENKIPVNPEIEPTYDE